MFSIVAVLLIASIVLVWGASSRESDFLQSQQHVVENSVIGASNQITQKITDLRQSVKLFAQKEKHTLKQVAQNPDNLDLYDSFVESVKSEFPDAVAITVANKHGVPYIEDFDGFILDICRFDIKKYSAVRHPPEVFIHPNPLAYHFDIMVKVDIGLNEQSIFFVSFSPQLLSEILNNSELFSHQLLLIKRDSRGLIEVTSKGARDLLPAEKLYISDSQRQQIVHSHPVNHTSWELIDIPINDYLIKHTRGIWLSTLSVIGLMVVFSCILLVALNRAEKSAKKQTQEAVRDKVAAEFANKAKSNFLANMSHEIRTPLTAIIGYGETLLRSDQTMKERVEAVNTIINSGEHLLNLINDILDVSKIEADKLVLEQVKESPFRLMQEVESIMSGQAKKKGLEFSIQYDFPLPKYVYSDYVRIKQILLNLCSNAIKFTQKGYIKITMRYEQEMDRLYFIVQDSGIGMSDESQDKVFESFTQADSSTTRKYGGTGLGLTLSKQLARLLGGEIDIDSKLGLGSTFAVYVPTNIKESKNIIFGESDIPVHSEQTKDFYCFEKLIGKALVAEDNEINQKLIALNLNKMGLDVVTVDNGKKAIDQALAEHFDIVFMDMQMPVMGGVEAVNRLKEKGYQQPIVALTANALQEDKEKCLTAGCSDFVTKPIHYEQLYEVAKNYVRTRSENLNDDPLYPQVAENDMEYQALITVFVESLPALANKLKFSAKEEEWELVASLLHHAKGSGGSYGYPDITQLAAKIEFQLVSEKYNEVLRLLDDLYELFDRAILGQQQSNRNLKFIANQ